MIVQNQLSNEFDYVQQILSPYQTMPSLFENNFQEIIEREQPQCQLQQFCYFSPFEEPYYPNKVKYQSNSIKAKDQSTKISQQIKQKPHQNNTQQKIFPIINSIPEEQPKNKQYPTKNFLPSFRSSFLNYLSDNFNKEEFELIEIVKRIRRKDSINLCDYQDLFRTEIFRPFLRTYFKNKVIYRDLLQSRIEYKTKRNYFKKIYVFQRAFERGVFKKIN